jgi:hypothetical protein
MIERLSITISDENGNILISEVQVVSPDSRRARAPHNYSTRDKPG